MTPWVLVTADVVETSGQGMANLALAAHLAARGTPVHVVAHRCADSLLARPTIRWHRVPRPFGSGFLGERLLSRAGVRVAARVVAETPAARVVVNGGNCAWSDVNWVHMVHHAWRERLEGPGRAAALRLELARRVDRRRERRIVGRARLVVANSEKTRRELEDWLRIEPARVRVVYLGIDPARFGPVSPSERSAARATLEVAAGAPVVAMVGGIGHDRKKGFDHLFAAWRHVVAARADAVLVVAGGGALDPWKAAAASAGLAGSIRWLGEVQDVPRVLAASDLLVSPTRYDSYGMNVHEAVCRGIMTLVSRAAGVAERFPPDLSPLVFPPPGEEPEQALAARILQALAPTPRLQGLFADLADRLRARTWDHMAADLVGAVEAGT